jgi:high-affinity iron transporter
MDFSNAIPTFLITLREGVEAALVVGIVMAYLKKVNRTELYAWVFVGIATGLFLSGIVGLIFNAVIQNFSSSNPAVSPVIEPLLEGIFSLVAIAMLSWMLIWMANQGKAIKGKVEGTLNQTLGSGKKAGWGILGLILFAILREGFEVVLFIAAKFQEGIVPATGAIAGIITASGIGIAIFKFGIKFNIQIFFKVMGIFLLLIVSGLVISALGHLDIALGIFAQSTPNPQSICFFHDRFALESSCVLGKTFWDLSLGLSDDHFPGIVFKSLFGYQDKLYIMQAIAYLGFLIAAITVYFKALSGGTTTSKTVPKTATPSE